MDTRDQHNLLQIRLSGDVDSLTPHYLIQWLDYLADDYEFASIDDVVLSFVGLSESVNNLLEIDGLSGLGAPIGGEDSGAAEWYAAVENGDLVIRESTTDDELCRAELPVFLMQLNALIEFMSDVYGHPLSALELRDFLLLLWHPVFC